MRLSLTFPASWELKHTPGNRRLAVLPGSDGKPRLIITFGGLTILPDEQRGWIEEALLAELPAGAHIAMGASSEWQTAAGWPMRLVEAQMLATRPDVVIEERVCAFYAFMEHAAVAMLRAGNKAHIEDNRDELLAILQSGRPDFSTPGQPVCLAQVWSIEQMGVGQRQPRHGELPPRLAAGERGLVESLAQTETALAAAPGAALNLERGQLLRRLGRHAEALTDFQTAAALAPSATTHHWLGLGLAAVGREAEAIAAWEAAIAREPAFVEAYYDAAQAHYKLGEFASALARWQQAFTLDPTDFLTLRKVIQSLYALGRFSEADGERARLRQIWHNSTDPRARMMHEYVFDQLQAGTRTVYAYETLQSQASGPHTLYAFRVIEAHSQTQTVAVQVETSEPERLAGTPYILSVVRDGERTVMARAKLLPPYVVLRAIAIKLLGAANLASPPPVPEFGNSGGQLAQ